MVPPSLCFAVATLWMTISEAHSPHIYYMHDECGSSTTVTNDVRVQLTSNTRLLLNWNCSTTLEADTEGDQLLVQIRNLNTSPSVNCSENRLNIIGTDGHTELNGEHGDCGSTPSTRSFVTDGNSVTFVFSTDGTTQNGQFDILVTSFSLSINGTCSNDRFLCDNNRCVSWDVTCNGFNDCGDNSDELDSCGLGVAAISGLAVGSLICFVIVFLVIVAKVRRKRFKRLRARIPTDVQTKPRYGSLFNR
ncbi:low-density lipoprotein receptor-related protein 3-like [Haliotis asinina]|uniref:low-density lipoprotein receptor-related protein 3-like n=1 Tax=Haliotis asinina TaxID=109174 RepID=UPI003531CC4E